MRVVDPEDLDAVPDPELEDRAQLVPQGLPVLGLEVERVDVLVFLRRVLGVLDGAVGALAEPGRVLADERVVGRDLERDVERDADATGSRPLRRARRSPRWCRGPGGSAVCPPSGPPIAQGTPGSSGPELVTLFAPLRNVVPIGWIGGRYRTSKPSPCTYARRSMTSRSVPWRPGFGDVERGNSSYQLEKRAWTGSTTMLERRFEGRDVVAVGVAAHPRVEVVVERAARGRCPRGGGPPSVRAPPRPRWRRRRRRVGPPGPRGSRRS